jgi:sigma-E factor negative regulatory protein RseB
MRSNFCPLDMNVHFFSLRQLICAAGIFTGFVLSPNLMAQPSAKPVLEGSQKNSMAVSDWLVRMHEASRSRSYTGVIVVTAGGLMASSRISHACDGVEQFDQVEALSGLPRTTYRKNNQVLTFSPLSKMAISEKRESLGNFPDLLKSADTKIDQFYTVSRVGHDRVAGFEAEQILIEPKDKMRFSYRVWSEKASGLVLKMETIGEQRQILEQVSFSELMMSAPVSMRKISELMSNTTGYRVVTIEKNKTTAKELGWELKPPVAGFQSMNCFLRPEGSGQNFQWIFSDGLASVSLFIEDFDQRQSHRHEGLMAIGATHTLTLRRKDISGDWWFTLVGEVPPQTLQAFARGLQRRQ